MLTAGFRRYRDWVKACNYYNSGSPDTHHTTGHDYGPDVMGRQAYLAALALDDVELGLDGDVDGAQDDENLTEQPSHQG